MKYLTILLVLALSCTPTKPSTIDHPAAMNTIREYMTQHGFEHETTEYSARTIESFEQAIVNSKSETSIKVNFKSAEGGKLPSLLFIFENTEPNTWILKAIEPEGSASTEVKDWLTSKKNLNVPVKPMVSH